MAKAAAAPRRWSPPPLIRARWLRVLLLVGVPVYLALALGTLEVRWARVAEGLERGAAFLVAFARPDFLSRWDDIRQGLLESLTMAIVSTAAGIALSVPIGLGAARNVAPLPVYLLCRAVIALSRTFQEVIIAILFVKMFGFGPLAGAVTLAFATIGFLGKLLAEDIEEIDPAPVEAVRATGASWPQVIAYGVQPQVMPRLVGLSLYRLDINFRESAVLGIVGAGGIGATLNTAFDRYEFDTAAAVLLTIIAIVMAAEYLSGLVRARVQ
jgi:phosphonate transport system permease protein